MEREGGSERARGEGERQGEGRGREKVNCTVPLYQR